MDQELKQYLDARFAEVDRRAEAMEDSMKALIVKTETNLLGAFYNWARPMEARVQNASTMVLGFDLRLGLAEQRISELERKRLT